MTEANLPSSVYRLAQKEFEAIPGRPWVYWVSENIRGIFKSMHTLGEYAYPKVGLQTGENKRFVKYWWEVGRINIDYKRRKVGEKFEPHLKWIPYMKGGGFRRWLGNQENIVNWFNDGYELRNFADENGRLKSRPQNMDYYFREGITYSYLTSGTFSARYSPGGFIFDVAGSSLFPNDIFLYLSILNSRLAGYCLKLINPTVNFQVGDLARLPIPLSSTERLRYAVRHVIQVAFYTNTLEEISFDFISPASWLSGIEDAYRLVNLLCDIEKDIDDEVFALYGLSDADRETIDAESFGDSLDDNGENDYSAIAEEEDEIEASITQKELAVHRISYTIGIVLGRFQPGVVGSLGSAIYRRDDFTVGSLPASDEAEFDKLIGPPEPFAYIDGQGGRHVFLREVEEQLRALADMDSITVLDEGHPDDLPAKVLHALELMLGELGAREVVEVATGEAHQTLQALRRFLERDFFTKWHVKWYRKRPVYWLLQSPKRLYGVYLFHERLTRDTLFVIQRQYVDKKLNLTRQLLAEKRAQAEKAESARERRELNKEAENLETLLLDLEEFARRLKTITDRGYTPHIDDGVILNMAPLHEVIPAWNNEPRKYWDGLERGDYDWAQLAMDYWPERVREKCRRDKSLAIAHGHEEWYESK